MIGFYRQTKPTQTTVFMSNHTFNVEEEVSCITLSPNNNDNPQGHSVAVRYESGYVGRFNVFDVIWSAQKLSVAKISPDSNDEYQVLASTTEFNSF